MTSLAEDFANDVEYMLFQPKVLKSKSPGVYRWLSDYLGASLKLRGSCVD